MIDHRFGTSSLRPLLVGGLFVFLYCLTVAFGPRLVLSTATADAGPTGAALAGAQLVANASCMATRCTLSGRDIGG